MAAFVRVLGPPNSNFLVGYPGISATLPRIEGKVEIRPKDGVSAPVAISLVSISPGHPTARNGGHSGQGAFIMEVRHREGARECGPDGPTIRAVYPVWERRTRDEPEDPTGQPAASEPDGRDAFVTPVPIQRYDTLSTFGMYNRPESADMVSDHLITLGISLPRWSYGPLDPVSVYIKLSPNLDHMKKATKVMIQKITMAIEEEITFNHEGDEPTKKVNRIAKQTTPIGIRMPGTGYTTNLGLVFPSKENRDAEGIIRRGKPHFPMYGVNSFTTTGSLYKIEFFLIIKAHMTNTRDIVLRQPIIVCPFDQQACKEEMESIEQAAKDASHVDANNPMLPARTVIKATDRDALKALGFTSRTTRTPAAEAVVVESEIPGMNEAQRVRGRRRRRRTATPRRTTCSAGWLAGIAAVPVADGRDRRTQATNDERCNA
ncbi:hypothetical protein O988_04902 [Pseudogymnoascus sp. VKM F-3808]|nr:hypothetical protein O988_04902 [Pseudogymnoascus sp. VKM F-3808]